MGQGSIVLYEGLQYEVAWIYQNGYLELKPYNRLGSIEYVKGDYVILVDTPHADDSIEWAI